MIRALSEHWGWPSSLMRVCVDLIRLDHDIAGQAPLGADGLAALATDALLSTLLDAAPICDVDMERLLTKAGAPCSMLQASRTAPLTRSVSTVRWPASASSTNTCSLPLPMKFARRAICGTCFRAALETGAAVPGLWLVAVAAYFPLHSLPLAGRLLERPAPKEITAEFHQQVREPAEERWIRATIPRLTDIEDDVSLLVQRQYEENRIHAGSRFPHPGKPTVSRPICVRPFHWPFSIGRRQTAGWGESWWETLRHG